MRCLMRDLQGWVGVDSTPRSSRSRVTGRFRAVTARFRGGVQWCYSRWEQQGRTLHFQLLGELEVVSDGERVEVAGHKQRALLAVLLLHANEVVGPDRLIEALWGEEPPGQAAKSVQVHVWRLRKALASVSGGRERRESASDSLFWVCVPGGAGRA
jgi:DNA-binding response OmpR family regulator